MADDSGLNFQDFMPALGSFLSGGASIYDMERKTDNIIETMELSTDQFFAQENIINQQKDEVDRTLGDTMSQSGLQAMKNQALLRAGAAETGTSGGTTENVIKNVYMTQALDESILIGRARQQKVDLSRRSEMNKMSLTARLAQLSGSLETSTSAALSTGAAALSGFTTGYSMMTNPQRENYFKF